MPAKPLPKKILARQHEITADFTRLVHAHVDDLVAGRATEALEIRDFASQLCLHPTHLSNTVKLVTGEAACAIYERKLVAEAQALLLDSRRTIADVAAQLTYDPSNFTKFFKHFVGLTPKQFREQHGAAPRPRAEKSELAAA
jgi:AraC-like DNA-binding protein